eukprot:TRINITY_DN4169_c0_g1_i3.p1 TRINITY_DN4169_c0_g1~~TRINITY_DN4169_c0_g1_i3.p1  ORF type:complete len:148 (-),score=26.31 TRINITY_DN4169_c0_g1_i3:53-496(-)
MCIRDRSNIDLLKKYFQLGADPYGQSRDPDSDLAHFLDLLSTQHDMHPNQYVEYTRRMEWEAVPLLPLENIDQRRQQFSQSRLRHVRHVHAQPSVYFTREMRDEYEQQTRLNIYAESEVLQFKTWSAKHLNALCDTPLSPSKLRLTV